MKVATGLSRVSGMFRCNRLDGILDRTMRKEQASRQPRSDPTYVGMKEIAEMAMNYNPREHRVRYK
jgi:hypothetical protein